MFRWVILLLQNLRSGLAYATIISLLVCLVVFPTLSAYAVNPLIITKTSSGITQSDGNPATVPNGGIVQVCNHKNTPIVLTVTVNGVQTFQATIQPGQCINLTVGSPQLPPAHYKVHDPSDTLDLIGTLDTSLEDAVFDFTVEVTPVGGYILSTDMTALFVAGAMTNAFWIVPTLGGIAGAAIALFKVKRKHN